MKGDDRNFSNSALLLHSEVFRNNLFIIIIILFFFAYLYVIMMDLNNNVNFRFHRVYLSVYTVMKKLYRSTFFISENVSNCTPNSISEIH